MKVLDRGSWNNNATLTKHGGMRMKFDVKNVNVLGTTLTIDSNLGGSKSSIIPPQMTVEFDFTCFGNEPMTWQFDVSTNSDAFIVTWVLYSTWIPGDPPNPNS